MRLMHENPVRHLELSALLQADVRSRLDSYLKNRAPVDFLSELRRILSTNPTPGCAYNM